MVIFKAMKHITKSLLSSFLAFTKKKNKIEEMERLKQEKERELQFLIDLENKLYNNVERNK